jgi:hypothetical protein
MQVRQAWVGITPEEASHASNLKALELRGEFAALNALPPAFMTAA